MLNRQAAAAKGAGYSSFSADRPLQKLFASAAVEMWQRAVHSFIVSAGLTDTSPIWASVAGYYSSHYAVRGYAHLLGKFVLYDVKCVIDLVHTKGSFRCELQQKYGRDGEHKAYWRLVKESAEFGSDPFLSIDNAASPVSDSAHRNKANYTDNIGNFARFTALTLAAVRERIEKISSIELRAIPLPDARRYPDLQTVQILAYHRLVRFRRYLDNVLAETNRFWRAQREPQWCQDLVDFQVTDPDLSADSN